MELLHNSRSFQGFAKLSGWDFGQVGGNRGKSWNLNMNTGDTFPFIQFFCCSQWNHKLDLWVVWHGFQGALECQQECAKTYRCEHLGCKDVMVIEASAYSRCENYVLIWLALQDAVWCDCWWQLGWNVECGTNLWQVRTNRGHPVCLLSSGMQLF